MQKRFILQYKVTEIVQVARRDRHLTFSLWRMDIKCTKLSQRKCVEIARKIKSNFEYSVTFSHTRNAKTKCPLNLIAHQYNLRL